MDAALVIVAKTPLAAGTVRGDTKSTPGMAEGRVARVRQSALQAHTKYHNLLIIKRFNKTRAY
jgi:hypothetical protein